MVPEKMNTMVRKVPVVEDTRPSVADDWIER
ncbi:hypothetical protein HNQ81_001205 [Desulfoprunum benzoelyticum]|uniref:Uncharacterized protein n=1 Tax=Desulfoprunum benzoelyticum TaxID=1506996 RepID=A0A840V1B4_9BACT|nr:hypothetical protein [Desulfoprunum benzoelyticum]